ncbi:MAG TPA: ROK family protein [Nitrososphaerales archaeon]|nr:ROK family protein [Nitrososphaerales archaeon]
MAEKMAVAVDLGATRVRVCVGTKSSGIIRKAAKKMILSRRVDDYLAQITAIMKDLTKHSAKGQLQGICVASPGPLDLKRGSLYHTPNLPYAEVPVVAALKDAFSVDTYLMNDANAAALGEWLWGAGRGHENLFYLTISTGIGGGAVVDGNLLLGKDGNAAEIGHTTIDSAGRMTCGCGRPGHWEGYCSGRSIPAFARLLGDELGDKERESMARSRLLRRRITDAAMVFDEARRGDPFAVRVVAEIGKLNAIGVANVVDAFDPEIVTIGGGVALNNPEAILPPIVKHLRAHAINRVPDVRITPLEDDAGLLGALSVPFNPGLIGR